MKRILFGLVFAFALVFVIAPAVDKSSTVQASPDEPVVVFNHGDCTVSGFGGVYQGYGTVIRRGDGVALFICNATLVSGTAVDQVVSITYNGVKFLFNPGGQAHVIAPHGFGG